MVGVKVVIEVVVEVVVGEAAVAVSTQLGGVVGGGGVSMVEAANGMGMSVGGSDAGNWGNTAVSGGGDVCVSGGGAR